jgi:hypothetical protein
MSPRPGRVLHCFDVDLPFPRTPAMRGDPIAAALRVQIADLVRGAA